MHPQNMCSLMSFWKILLILSFFFMVTTGLGGVLHYPLFVRLVGQIGNHNEDLGPENKERRYNPDTGKKISLYNTVSELLNRSVDNSKVRIDSYAQEGMNDDKLRKSFYAVRGEGCMGVKGWRVSSYSEADLVVRAIFVYVIYLII